MGNDSQRASERARAEAASRQMGALCSRAASRPIGIAVLAAADGFSSGIIGRPLIGGARNSRRRRRRAAPTKTAGGILRGPICIGSASARPRRDHLGCGCGCCRGAA